MKPLLPLLAALLFTSAIFAEEPAVPDVIGKGFEAYQNNVQAAVGVWLKGSPMEPEGAAGVIAGLSQFETKYGRILGWETIRTVVISPATRRVYAIAKYEKGPLWMRFDCYLTPTEWIIPILNFSPKMDEILPPEMLTRSKPPAAQAGQ